MGKYSSAVAAISSSTCASCPVARPNSAAGAKGESECTSSLVCPSNQQVSADGTTCVSGCENGKYSVPTTNECQNRPVGTFNTDGFASGCRTCPFGHIGKEEGLSVCTACGDASRCPVGVGKELTLEQVVLRNGGVEQLYNTEAKAKPDSHCAEESGDVDILLYVMFGLSALIILAHSLWIKLLLHCISLCAKCGISKYKVLNRLDQLQTEWGYWEGEGNKQVIKPPKPSHFGAAYTVAFLPIAFYTIYQLVMANNPKCTVGLQVLSANRANGTMKWTIELPTVSSTTCTTFDSVKSVGFSKTSVYQSLKMMLVILSYVMNVS